MSDSVSGLSCPFSYHVDACHPSFVHERACGNASRALYKRTASWTNCGVIPEANALENHFSIVDTEHDTALHHSFTVRNGGSARRSTSRESRILAMRPLPEPAKEALHKSP